MITLAELRAYFKKEISGCFSTSEIKLMFNQWMEEKLMIKNAYYLLENPSILDKDERFFKEFTRQLKTGKPYQQLIGFAEFYGLRIQVNENVLIPRPETAELVDLIRKDFSNEREMPIRILDVCSGSGCIALALQSIFKEATIYGFEKSSSALYIANKNKEDLNLPVHFSELDILHDKWEIDENSLDILVSNPPYVLKSERAEMSKTVLDYEPELALFVEDTDPVLFYRHIAQQGLLFLKSKGTLYFEINERYGNENIRLLKQMGFEEITLFQDLQGKNRMMKARKK